MQPFEGWRSMKVRISPTLREMSVTVSPSREKSEGRACFCACVRSVGIIDDYHATLGREPPEHEAGIRGPRSIGGVERRVVAQKEHVDIALCERLVLSSSRGLLQGGMHLSPLLGSLRQDPALTAKAVVRPQYEVAGFDIDDRVAALDGVSASVVVV